MKKLLHQAGNGTNKGQVASDSTSTRHLSPTEASPPQSTIMDNAFFLLQMINTISDNYPNQLNSSIIPLKPSFNCYAALGVTESQILDEGNPFCDEISPDGRTSETTSYRNGWDSSRRATDLEDRSLALKRVLGASRQRKISNGDPFAGTLYKL